MRFAMLLAAIAALSVQPARAAEGLFGGVELVFGGYMDVTRIRYECDGVPANCGPIYEHFTMPWQKTQTWHASAFDDGSETFDIGHYRAGGHFTGLITYLGDGMFTGSNLAYDIDGGIFNCIGKTTCYGYSDVGSSATFRVVALKGAVPEPTTWALLLLGFGAVASVMRRRATSSRIPVRVAA